MNFFRTLYDRRNRNSHIWYHIKNISQYILPNSLFEYSLKPNLNKIKDYNEEIVLNRVNYYNKLEGSYAPDQNYITLNEFTLRNLKRFKPSTHFFDTYKYTRYFPKSLRIALLFGDNRINPPVPSIVKSRPIQPDNTNAVVLKLNALRHFMFVTDNTEFKNKKDMLVGRATLYRSNRKRFYELYFDHPMCNLGQVQSKETNPQWVSPRMTIDEHLQYKFILALEGNDVSSNLKWIMSSNSLAVMTRPKFETWFMEGTLVPDYHYVEIDDDFSNLEEKMRYYIENVEEANKIISHAHEYVSQFRVPRLEKLIALLVLQKYFEHHI